MCGDIHIFGSGENASRFFSCFLSFNACIAESRRVR